MDDADVAAEREEYTRKESLHVSRKPSGPVANGRCHWCDEVVSDHLRFCNTDCRDAYDREQRLVARGRG